MLVQRREVDSIQPMTGHRDQGEVAIPLDAGDRIHRHIGNEINLSCLQCSSQCRIISDRFPDDTIDSFRTRSPKIINFSDSDTTMAFCFYLKDKEDAELFYQTIEKWKVDQPEGYLIGLDNEKTTHVQDTEKEAEFDGEFEII